MKTRLNKGFTLIELLVVIAIIGILSGVVLASLNGARNKAKDASAKASMSAVRADAEMYWDDETTYYVSVDDTVCVYVKKLTDAATAQAGTAICRPQTNGDGYIAYVPLNDTTKWFCVDSTGNAKLEEAMPLSGALTCL